LLRWLLRYEVDEAVRETPLRRASEYSRINGSLWWLVPTSWSLKNSKFAALRSLYGTPAILPQHLRLHAREDVDALYPTAQLVCIELEVVEAAMRIKIREQLCLLIAITSGLALMVLAVTTWTQAHEFITEVSAETLAITAGVKANSMATDISFYEDLVQAVSTRSAIQEDLGQYNNGNRSGALLDKLGTEIRYALAGGIENKLLLQAVVYPRTPATSRRMQAIVNATGEGVGDTIPLPSTYANGSQVYLGDPGQGYPSTLYPNYTYPDQTDNDMNINYEGLTLYYNSTLLLGPLYLDSQSALISLSVAINNNTSRT
jgi:osomolarity two-component system, sensor histidine kinase SLN1